MKTVSSKLLIAALALFICLGAAGTAQAYAIYNHVDHKVCVATEWTYSICKFEISAHSTHNGGHGDSLSHAYVTWYLGHGKCRTNNEDFTIPDGGYARIYKHEVKIYKHNGTHIDTKKISKVKCADN